MKDKNKNVARNAMANANKTTIALLLFFCNSSPAGTLYYFLDDNIVAFEESGKITGSYSNTMRSNNRSLQCKFFFKTVDKNKNSTMRRIFAEEKNQYFHAKSNGWLYKKNDAWRIQIEFPSEGCRLFPWQLFSPDMNSAAEFSVAEKKSALGLYVLKKDMNYYHPDGTYPEHSKRDFLWKGDLVAVIKRKNDLSYIDHHFEKNGKIYKVESSGWVKSSDLGDPISRK